MPNDFFCTVCGRAKFSNHVCPPVFQCRFSDTKNYGEHWDDVRETNAESAAEKFAEEYDLSNEYNILQQGDRCEEIIEVRDGNGTVNRWSIHAESVPHYFAEEAEDEEEPASTPVRSS